jgi:hypothetical protein
MGNEAAIMYVIRLQIRWLSNVCYSNEVQPTARRKLGVPQPSRHPT